MATLEALIDELYRGPLSDFVGARTALGKTLSGAEARRVKSLSKPTVVPWAVNQVYWHARHVYARLLQSGQQLRAAQLAALNGGAPDVRAPTEVNRRVVADAVSAALRLASAAHLNPSAEALTRMFEAISVASTPPESPGRYTKPLQLAGFEALEGVTIKPPVGKAAAPEARTPSADRPASVGPSAHHASEIRRLERQRMAAERRKEAAIKKAEEVVRRARNTEIEAREGWDQAKRRLDKAEQDLAALRV